MFHRVRQPEALHGIFLHQSRDQIPQSLVRRAREPQRRLSDLTVQIPQLVLPPACAREGRAAELDAEDRGAEGPAVRNLAVVGFP